MIQSSQLDPLNPAKLILNCEATSFCQLSEWGMRMLQASFPRLKEALLCEEDGERMVILHLMTLLHNFAAKNMGMNQIFNSFMPNANSYYGYEIQELYNDDV